MSPSSKPLPTLPTVAARLLSLIADPDVDVRKIGDAIRVDPSLTSKIIRAANSVQYYIGRPIADVDRAVVLLGKRTISTLALTFSLSEAVAKKGRLRRFYQQYWTESVVQALTAELLANAYCRTEAGLYFSSGLLQDLGRLYLLQNFGEDYVLLMDLSVVQSRHLIDLEQEAFRINHPDLAAGMLSEWQFPQQVVFAVAGHHKCVVAEANPVRDFTLDRALKIAALVGEFFCQPHRGAVHVMLEESLAQCPDPRMSIDELTDHVHQRLANMAELFNIEAEDIPSPSEMLNDAMQQIAWLAMSQEELDSEQVVQEGLMRENNGLRQRLREVMQRTQIDPVTGVFTREVLAARMEDVIRAAAKHRGSLGLLFIDIDHFKQINDTYGHTAGDRVLRHVAQAIGSCVRGKDFAARYGGEEFVVVVGRSEARELLAVGERVRRAIASNEFVLDGHQASVTASIGATLIGPITHAAGIAQQALESADAAMYQAKRQGRNQVVVAQVTPRELVGAHGP